MLCCTLVLILFLPVDTDYLPLANDIIEITFEPQAQGLSVQKSECVRFVALDDSVQEGAEVFSVAVKAVSETVNTEHPNFASVLILDNDGIMAFGLFRISHKKLIILLF